MDAAALVAIMAAWGAEPATTEVPGTILDGVEAAWGIPGNVTPVVLDLGGNGLDLKEADADPHVLFDVDGDGVLERTGWIGADDAFLALDRNNDGLITTGDDISFTGDLEGAVTDLQGLVAFDTNNNGLIDAGDAGFGDFLVWQDANGDGVSTASELSSLVEAGIESIDLVGTATGESIETSDGNTVFALTSFTKSDGSTGEVGDVALRYLEVLETDDVGSDKGAHQVGEVSFVDSEPGQTTWSLGTYLPAFHGSLASLIGSHEAYRELDGEHIPSPSDMDLTGLADAQRLSSAMMEFDASVSQGGFQSSHEDAHSPAAQWLRNGPMAGRLERASERFL